MHRGCRCPPSAEREREGNARGRTEEGLKTPSGGGATRCVSRFLQRTGSGLALLPSVFDFLGKGLLSPYRNVIYDVVRACRVFGFLKTKAQGDAGADATAPQDDSVQLTCGFFSVMLLLLLIGSQFPPSWNRRHRSSSRRRPRSRAARRLWYPPENSSRPRRNTARRP